MQADYGRKITPQKQKEAIDKAVESSRIYMNRLIVVALAANQVAKSAKKDNHNRYYFRVTTKRFNTLRRTLKALTRLQQ